MEWEENFFLVRKSPERSRLKLESAVDYLSQTRLPWTHGGKPRSVSVPDGRRRNI
jgi:hypothetical protein